MLVATFNCNSVRVRLGTIPAWLDAHGPSDHTFVAARFGLQPGRRPQMKSRKESHGSASHGQGHQAG